MEYGTKRDYTVGLHGFRLRTFQPYVRVLEASGNFY